MSGYQQKPGTVMNLSNQFLEGNLNIGVPKVSKKLAINIRRGNGGSTTENKPPQFSGDLKCVLQKAKEYGEKDNITSISLARLNRYAIKCAAPNGGVEHFSIPMPSRSDLTLQNAIMFVILFAAFCVLFTEFKKRN